MFALVAIHFAAFGFWCWLLWSSRRAEAANGGSGSGARGGAGASGSQSARDLLRAYQKSSLGKG